MCCYEKKHANHQGARLLGWQIQRTTQRRRRRAGAPPASAHIPPPLIMTTHGSRSSRGQMVSLDPTRCLRHRPHPTSHTAVGPLKDKQRCWTQPAAVSIVPALTPTPASLSAAEVFATAAVVAIFVAISAITVIVQLPSR